jgi:hypothetical protein
MFKRARTTWRILAKSDLAVEEAMKEVRSKTGEEVDRETAPKWAARAVASYRLCAEATSIREKVERFSEGDDYRHEALEHAGTGGDTQALERIASETHSERAKALASFKEG